MKLFVFADFTQGNHEFAFYMHLHAIVIYYLFKFRCFIPLIHLRKFTIFGWRYIEYFEFMEHILHQSRNRWTTSHIAAG